MQEATSKNTSLNQLPAIATLVDKHFGWKEGSTNLDAGCGKYEKFTEFMRRVGIKNMRYDPYNRNSEYNKSTTSKLRESPADTATISNVLNVISDHQKRAELLVFVKNNVKKGGHIYITVYEGDQSGVGKISKDDCWQANLKTVAYVDLVVAIFEKVSRKGKLIIATA